MFIIALFIIAKTWKKPKYPFMDGKSSCGPHTLFFFNMDIPLCVCVAYKHTQWDVIQPYIY